MISKTGALVVLEGRVHCDGLGCDETYPVDHEYVGRTGFTDGKWLGWLYLDINRPDLIDRPLAFCRVDCLDWWINAQTMLKTPMPDDDADEDEVGGMAARRAKRDRRS